MAKLAFQSFQLSWTKSSRNLVKRNLANPLPGIEVGIPVTLFQNIFTTNHMVMILPMLRCCYYNSVQLI